MGSPTDHLAKASLARRVMTADGAGSTVTDGQSGRAGDAAPLEMDPPLGYPLALTRQ